MYVSVIQLYYERITGRISSWMAYNNRAMKKNTNPKRCRGTE